MSALKPYPAMRDSGVPWLGDVPEHWEVRRLKTLCSRSALYGANVAATSYTTAGVRFLRTTDITEDGQLNGSGVFLPQELIDNYLLADGDVLISRSGTIGRSFLYKRRIHGLCAYAGYLVRFVPAPIALPKYVFLFTKTNTFAGFLRVMSISSTIENVSGEKYANCRLPLPPHSEQTAIVRFLDHADGRIRRYIRAKQKLITLLEEQKQVIIQQAVAGQIDVRTGRPYPAYKLSGLGWPGKVPAHWRVERMRYLIEGKLTYGANAAAEYTDPTWPRYLRITDFSKSGGLRTDTFRSLPPQIAKEYLVRPGDVLLARSGATVGKAFLVSEEAGTACYAGYLIRARLDRSRLLPAFFFAFTQSASFARWKDETFIIATIQNIGADKYANLPVPVPPLDEQETLLGVLGSSVATLERAVQCATGEIAVVHEYRARLIADVVTGKLDVREAAAGLPEVDPLAAEDDRDAGSNPEAWSHGEELGVTGEQAET